MSDENKPAEPMVPKSRLDAKNSQLAELQSQLAELQTQVQTLEPRASGLEQAMARIAELQAERDNALTDRDRFVVSTQHGIAHPAAVAHMSETYAKAMAGTPEGERVAYDQWLPQVLTDRSGLDLVTQGFLHSYFEQAGQPQAPAEPAPAPEPSAEPAPAPAQATGQPAATWPRSNAGQRQMPAATAMTQAQIKEIVSDPVKFKAWREQNPEAFQRLKKR